MIINISCIVPDTVNKVDKVETGLDAVRTSQKTMDRELMSVRTGQETLCSHVNTMDRELMSVKTEQESMSTRQKDVSDRLDRDIQAIRNQCAGIIPRDITADGKPIIMILQFQYMSNKSHTSS